MYISKDIYEYLTYFVDCKTLLNLLSVNKEFSNLNYFLRIMNKKFPLLIKFKENNENLKKFYLKMMYSITKLEEKEFPYIPITHFNPYLYYKNESEKLWNVGLNMAAYTKDKKLINYMINKGAKEFKFAVINAITVGDHETTILLFSKIENLGEVENLIDKYFGIASACGDIKMINFFISKGAKDYENALEWAARNGHLEIVKNFKKYLTNFESAKELAEIGRHYEVIEYLNNN